MDPIPLKQLEREQWNESSRSNDEVMVNVDKFTKEMESPETLRGVEIYAKSNVYIFFPPGTLKPGLDGRQLAVRKLTMVKLYVDASWRVVKDEVLLKHPDQPMTFEQFLNSEHHQKLHVPGSIANGYGGTGRCKQDVTCSPPSTGKAESDSFFKHPTFSRSNHDGFARTTGRV